MSESYWIKNKAVSGNTIVSAPDSSFLAIDFDSDDFGEFAVLSFRVSVNDLKKLAANRSRFLEVSSIEIRSLLKAIVGNPEESEETHLKAIDILGGGK